MCCCTPPGTSQVYGQTMPILMARRRPPECRPRRGRPRRPPLPAPVPARASRSGSRSAVNTRWSMCQSCGCARDARLEDLAPAAGSSRRPSPAWCPRRAPGSPSWMCAPQPASVEPQRDRQQGGAGLHGQRRRAGHHPRLLAEEVHLDAAAGDVPVGRAGRPARPPAAAGPACRTGWSPPVAGSTSMPSPSRKATNRWNSDSGLSRSATVVNEPAPRAMIQCPGLLPVAHVRQREDHPAAGRQVGRAAVSSPMHVHAGR